MLALRLHKPPPECRSVRCRYGRRWSLTRTHRRYISQASGSRRLCHDGSAHNHLYNTNSPLGSKTSSPPLPQYITGGCWRACIAPRQTHPSRDLLKNFHFCMHMQQARPSRHHSQIFPQHCALVLQTAQTALHNLISTPQNLLSLFTPRYSTRYYTTCTNKCRVLAVRSSPDPQRTHVSELRERRAPHARL